MDLTDKKYLKSFSGLDNTDIYGKREIDGLVRFLDDLKNKPRFGLQEYTNKFDSVKQDLLDIWSPLQQHLVDSLVNDPMIKQTDCATQCNIFSLHNEAIPEEGIHCNHDHKN